MNNALDGFYFVWEDFAEKIMLLQCRLNLIQDFLAVSRHIVKMIPGGHIQQRRGLAGAQVFHEMLHIPAVLDIQGRRNLAVDTMVDHHIQHAAPQIHNQGKLLLRPLRGMMGLEPAHRMLGLV